MGAEAAVNAVYANKIAALADDDERAAFVAAKRDEYERDIDIVRLASELVVDAIVEPAGSCAPNWCAGLRSREARTAISPAAATASPPSEPRSVDRVSRERSTREPEKKAAMLNEEQEALRQTVAEFAREVVAPVIGEHYENHTFPYEIVRQMGKMGLFGLPFPEEYGGMGGDYFALCVAIEELARVDSSVAITLEAAVSLGAMPIYRFGTDGAEADLATAARQRRGAGRVRPDRAGLRLRRRRRDDPRGARRRPTSGSSTAARRSSPTPARTSRR